MTRLSGAVALVTGGASGIGRATAQAFAARGARLVVVDLNSGGAEKVAADIRDAGGEAIGLAGDVTEDGTFERLLHESVAAFGGVDVVMNNVGAISRGLPEHVPLTEWYRIFELNLFSTVRSNAVFVPYLIERGHGHIVNTASFAGLYSYSYDRLSYAAAKAGVVQLSEGLLLYLKPKGIGVTLLCPGPTRTNISSTLRSFGPETITRGPGAEFGFLEAEIVGEKVVAAVESDTFFLPTHDNVRDKLTARADDWDGFLAHQLGEMDRVPPQVREAR